MELVGRWKKLGSGGCEMELAHGRRIGTQDDDGVEVKMIVRTASSESRPESLNNSHRTTAGTTQVDGGETFIVRGQRSTGFPRHWNQM